MTFLGNLGKFILNCAEFGWKLLLNLHFIQVLTVNLLLYILKNPSVEHKGSVHSSMHTAICSSCDTSVNKENKIKQSLMCF